MSQWNWNENANGILVLNVNKKEKVIKNLETKYSHGP
jgi:hypothetical protein